MWKANSQIKPLFFQEGGGAEKLENFAPARNFWQGNDFLNKRTRGKKFCKVFADKDYDSGIWKKLMQRPQGRGGHYSIPQPVGHPDGNSVHGREETIWASF